MSYFRSYGLTGLKYVSDPLGELVLQENTAPSRKITSQIDMPDAMQAYQEELINMRVPDTTPRPDNQVNEEETRKRSRNIMNIMNFGDVRGDTDLAYKPEIEQVPQPYRKLSENKYSQFQRDKDIHARYACRGEAQKDDMMRHPLGDPKYRHADTRKYIPGIVRTMQKVSIDDHEVPLIPKSNVGKPIQNYRKIENGWILQYCRDTCRVNGTKKKITITKGIAPREKVEDVYEDRTNVNIMKSIVKGDGHQNRLQPEMENYHNEAGTASIEKGRPLPTRKFVTFGNFVDIKQFVDAAEKVNNIEKAIKKSTQRPKLGLKTIDPNDVSEDSASIEKPKQTPRKGNTFIIHAAAEGLSKLAEGVQSTEQKEKKHHKQNRATGAEPVAPFEEISDWGRDEKHIKKQQIRALMHEMNPFHESQVSTNAKHHKTKQNMNKHVEGHDTSDSTSVTNFGRKRYATELDSRSYRRIEEPNASYDDGIADIQTKAYVDKAKQNRFVHPDTIIITDDPYADVNPKQKKVISYGDNKAFVTSEYTLRKQLSDEL